MDIEQSWDLEPMRLNSANRDLGDLRPLYRDAKCCRTISDCVIMQAMVGSHAKSKHCIPDLC